MAQPTAEIKSTIIAFLVKYGRRGKRTKYVVTSASALYLMGLRDTLNDIDILADTTVPHIKCVINGIQIDCYDTCQGLEEDMYANFDVIDGINVAVPEDILRLKKIVSALESRREKWPQDRVDMRNLRNLIASNLWRSVSGLDDSKLHPCYFYRGNRISAERYSELAKL